MTTADVPPYHALLEPTLKAVFSLGGSASISEIVETVIKREGFTDAQQAVLHHDGPGTEIGYRLAWARTYLKGMGLLTNSSRGNHSGQVPKWPLGEARGLNPGGPGPAALPGHDHLQPAMIIWP
jgi:hypothetical protein